MRMLLSVALLAALPSVVDAGEVSLKGVHLCCGACVRDATDALENLEGVSKISVNRNSKIVTFTAANDAAASRGIESLTDAGFAGKISHDGKAVPLPSTGVTEDKKVEKITFSGLHLCCGACVKGVQKAVGDVPGVKVIDVDRKATTVTLTGEEISSKAAVDALIAGGYFGTLEE